MENDIDKVSTYLSMKRKYFDYDCGEYKTYFIRPDNNEVILLPYGEYGVIIFAALAEAEMAKKGSPICYSDNELYISNIQKFFAFDQSDPCGRSKAIIMCIADSING